MRIAFKHPIYDVDGKTQRKEPETDKDGNVLSDVKAIGDFESVVEARAAGHGDAFMSGGRVSRLVVRTVDIDLGRVCVAALTRSWQGEEISPDDKYERWRLAIKIQEACDGEELGVVDLEASSLSKIISATDNWGKGERAVIPYFARARELLNGGAVIKGEASATAAKTVPKKR